MIESPERRSHEEMAKEQEAAIDSLSVIHEKYQRLFEILDTDELLDDLIELQQRIADFSQVLQAEYQEYVALETCSYYHTLIGSTPKHLESSNALSDEHKALHADISGFINEQLKRTESQASRPSQN